MSQFFNSVVQHFMQHPVVCRVAQEDFYLALEKEDFLQQVNDVLAIFDRVIIPSSSGSAFVCCYNGCDSPQAKSAVKENFRSSAQDLQPLVLFLGLAQGSTPSATPVLPGSKISRASLLKAVEESEILRRQLDQLRQSRLFGSSASDPANQLTQVLKRLRELGYLKTLGNDLQFIATGMWDVVYDQLRFIQQYSGISAPDEEFRQGEMM